MPRKISELWFHTTYQISGIPRINNCEMKQIDAYVLVCKTFTCAAIIIGIGHKMPEWKILMIFVRDTMHLNSKDFTLLLNH